MKLIITIEIHEGGLTCRAQMDAKTADPVETNTLCLGALEVAKASLLARRWGVNIGNFEQPALVPDNTPAPPAKAKARRHK